MPKGSYIGRNEMLAEAFVAEVKVCLRHHRLLVGPIPAVSLRKEMEA